MGTAATRRAPVGRSASGTVSKSPSTVKPAGNDVTISAVGDMELGNTPKLPPDPSTYLQQVESALAAPLVFGNLEGTLTDASASKCAGDTTNCYAFRTPPAFAQIFRQNGITVLNSANNHSHDYGQAGVSDTSAALEAAGITQAGLLGQIGLVTDGSTNVAFVDFAPYTDVNNLLNFSTAKELIAQAKSEANVVVVYMHAGAEGSNADHVTGNEETYDGEDRGNAEVFAHNAIDAGAALVIASGPHVLRGLEFYSRSSDRLQPRRLRVLQQLIHSGRSRSVRHPHRDPACRRNLRGRPLHLIASYRRRAADGRFVTSFGHIRQSAIFR